VNAGAGFEDEILARYAGRELSVKGVRQVEVPVEPLTGRELGRLVAAVEEHAWGPEWLSHRSVALVALLVRAGLRVGEAVALDLGGVETRERSGWALVRQGKGLKQRRVPLSLQAREALEAYLKVRPEWVGEALFITKSGKRVHKRDVQRMVTDAAARAGIGKKVTPHILRHTFATRFLRKGGDLATLRSILGHASIATSSRYLHPDAAQVQEMVEEL
jgi:site-specific recombinase XerD